MLKILPMKGGSFIPHLDGAKGWVLSISIGDTGKELVVFGLI
jgi:hypothetical protein